MITRNQLGWPSTKAGSANTNQGIIIHYDGSNQGLAGKSCNACRDYWRNTRVFHIGTHRWADIGYAYGVCPHGKVYEGRGYGRVQAAAKQSPGKLPDGNTRWVNVTFMNGPNEMPTPEQLRGFYGLRAMLMESKGMGGQVMGHRDFTATACPGDINYRLVTNGTLVKSATSRKDNDVNAKDIWHFEIPVPWGTATNPEWRASSLLLNANERIRSLEIEIKSLHEKIDRLLGNA